MEPITTSITTAIATGVIANKLSDVINNIDTNLSKGDIKEVQSYIKNLEQINSKMASILNLDRELTHQELTCLKVMYEFDKFTIGMISNHTKIRKLKLNDGKLRHVINLILKMNYIRIKHVLASLINYEDHGKTFYTITLRGQECCEH